MALASVFTYNPTQREKKDRGTQKGIRTETTAHNFSYLGIKHGADCISIVQSQSEHASCVWDEPSEQRREN